VFGIGRHKLVAPHRSAHRAEARVMLKEREFSLEKATIQLSWIIGHD